MHISSTPAKVILIALALAWGCYEDPPTPPLLWICQTPDEWVGMTCEEWCGTGKCHEGPAEDCHDATVVGYKRQDACWSEDAAHDVVLPQGCDDPLPETLTDSVYFIKCCCYEPY